MSISSRLRRPAALTAAFTAASLTFAATPALAATTYVVNGDFVGARYAFGPDAGQLIPTAYGFGSHTYTQAGSFAWTNTGTGALDAIAANTAEISSWIAHLPSDLAGYSGNIYVADASPSYSVGTYLEQVLTGLTVGQTYELKFQQAAGDYYTQANYATPFTDTAGWSVYWGGTSNIVYDPVLNGFYGVLSGYTGQHSTSMTIDPTTGTSPWQARSMFFTATDSSELLSFFANGSGAPPFALLADVSVVAVPEPSSWGLAVLGFGMLGMALRRRRSRAARA